MMDELDPHPLPPVDLPARAPIIRYLDGPWYRIHSKGRDPIHWGRAGKYRFDSPSREFGVLYLGKDVYVALIETLGHTTGTRFLTEEQLQSKILSRITTSRHLKLIDLVESAGLACIGADARLCVGEHVIARSWSQALYHHPAEPDGILYFSRRAPDRLACAVFDRAATIVQADEMGGLLSPELIAQTAEILDHYGYAIR